MGKILGKIFNCVKSVENFIFFSYCERKGNFLQGVDMKKLFLFVLFILLGIQCACATNPRVGVLKEENSYEKSAQQVRKTIFLEQQREVSDYATFVYTDLKPYIENALVENDLVVTNNKEQADFIGLVDFGTQGAKTIIKNIYRPHYEYYHDYPYGSDMYDHYGTGMYTNTGSEYYTKKYQVYSHFLILTCNEQKQGKSAMAWEVEIIYNSKYDDFRVNIKDLIEPLAKNIKQAMMWQNVVAYEFDNLD